MFKTQKYGNEGRGKKKLTALGNSFHSNFKILSLQQNKHLVISHLLKILTFKNLTAEKMCSLHINWHPPHIKTNQLNDS